MFSTPNSPHYIYVFTNWTDVVLSLQRGQAKNLLIIFRFKHLRRGQTPSCPNSVSLTDLLTPVHAHGPPVPPCGQLKKYTDCSLSCIFLSFILTGALA